MANRPVTSREYKLMLNTDRFQDRSRGTEVFFDLLSFLIKKEGVRSSRRRTRRRGG
jgi:hypothetical protein